MFRVKHFSTKRSITKHRKHIFFYRNAFCGVVWLVAYDTFSLKTSKNYLWKRWDDHHKIPFSNNRKTKHNIQPLSYCHFLQQTRSHTTRFNQSRVQIRQQSLHIYAIKDRRGTCLWQNRGGQIVSQAILDENKPLSRPIRRWKVTNPHKTDVSQDTKFSLKIAKI